MLLATAGTGWAWVPGIVGIASLAGAAAVWLTLSLGYGHDPLLPEITDDEAAVYLESRQAKKRRAVRRQRQAPLHSSTA